jgi:hypothetical protein
MFDNAFSTVSLFTGVTCIRYIFREENEEKTTKNGKEQRRKNNVKKKYLSDNKYISTYSYCM